MPRDFSVERSVIIRARRSTVFRFFTDPVRFAAWWGAGSSIEARPGGRVDIHYPNGVTAGGEVEEIEADQVIVFTYGYDEASKPIVRGGSRVTVTMRDHSEGTLVWLEHRVADVATRDAHVSGWRFQLSLLANLAAAEQHAGLSGLVDRFFAAWAGSDAPARRRDLDAVVSEQVSFKDAFATLQGRDELATHIEISQKHMPGMVLTRDGDPEQCQGVALVRWCARGPDGTTLARGTNVFELDAEGRIGKVVGFRDR